MTAPDSPPVSQPVLTQLTAAAIFLVVTINPGGEDTARDLLSDLTGLERSVGFRLPEGKLACVLGIGSNAWDRLFAGPRPAELHPFRARRRSQVPGSFDARGPLVPRQGQPDGPVL